MLSAFTAPPVTSRWSPRKCWRAWIPSVRATNLRLRTRVTIRALHVASEVFPLLKTGGLGDVIGALPAALHRRGVDARVLLPGFPEIRGGIDAPRRLLTFGPVFGASIVTLCAGRLPGSEVRVYVIDAPFLYARGGNPYVGP